MTDHKIATVNVQELKEQMDNNPKTCLIDVRELYEWQMGRIPRAIHIPKDELVARIEEVVPNPDQPIYLHCKGGVRSLYAAHCLLGKGYKEVYSVDGGIDAWIRNGYSIEE